MRGILYEISGAFAAVSVALLAASCEKSDEKPSDERAGEHWVFRGVGIGASCTTMKKSGIVEGCIGDPAIVEYDYPCPSGDLITHSGGCRLKDRTVANVYALQALAMFDKDKFVGIDVVYRNVDYDAVLTNALSAYGDACSRSVEPLQNAFGAQFENDVTRWCFAEGTLTLARYNGDVNQSHLYFEQGKDDPPPPKLKPEDI